MALIAAAVSPARAAAQDETAQRDDVRGQATSTIYSYNENDIPEVFFFPKDKARWDGSKVTMKEWYMLTDLQKQKFVTEYLNQVKADNAMDFDALWMDYMRALNLFSLYSNEKATNEPSTRFIDKILAGQGKLVPKSGPAQEAPK